jgi:hypothetical protein
LSFVGLIFIAYPGEVEAGCPGWQHLRNSVRAVEPRPRCRTLRHDAVARDRQGHARRRIERRLKPFQHRLQVEPLIGLEMRRDPRRIDARLAQELERVNGERIAQA